MVNLLTAMLCPKNVKAVHCVLMKWILQDIKNGLPIMFVRWIFLDLLVQWNQQELLICSNDIRDTNYIGDGHSSVFNAIKESKPYGHTIITKLECVGHVEKRLGARCQKLRVTWKGKKLSDEKDNMGAGRITNKAIDILQNYYGTVGRNNVRYLYGMKSQFGRLCFIIVI